MTLGRVSTWFSVSVVFVFLVYTAPTVTAEETPDFQPNAVSPQSSPAASAEFKPAVAITEQTDANSRGPDSMTWLSIDGGGGTSGGGSLSLTAALGQPESGLSAVGTQTLVGGLWASSQTPHLFSDSFESGDTLIWSTNLP